MDNVEIEMDEINTKLSNLGGSVEGRKDSGRTDKRISFNSMMRWEFP